MTLTDQIAALTEWPKRAEYIAHHTAHGTLLAESADYWGDAHDAALARLALARKWMKSQPHGLDQNGIDCKAFNPSTSLICTCGRNALLAALEPQK